VRKREIVGVALIVVAFALTPFAYGASVALGVIAVTIGLAGLVLFATARPWRARRIEPDQYVEPRKVPLGLAIHDLERAALMGGPGHDPARAGLSDGGGAHSGDSGGDGGDGGGSH